MSNDTPERQGNTGRAKPRGRHNGPPRMHALRPRHDDPYRDDGKVADSIVCDDCGLVQNGGRWYRGAPPFGEVRGGLCPACRRIRDHRPAGTLRLPAAMAALRDEVTHLVRDLEQAERDEHPLERVVAIAADGDGLLVTTTGIHLARRIARQLERRFHTRATFHYTEDDELRVDWQT